MKSKTYVMAALLVSLAIFLFVCDLTPITANSIQGNIANQPTRQGAWLDSLVFSEVSDPYQAVAQLQSNDLDIYANSVTESTLFQTVLEDQDLTFTQEFGSYTELTFNPYGPTFNDGRLNPFSIAKIRQAMNWLIDRDKIAQEIYGGLAIPRYLPLTPIDADYTRFKDTVDALETQYAYNFSLAETTIISEMLSLGAIRENGTWHFNSEPVTIIFIIRVEDQRRGIGDYVSDQLEAIGFEVDRQYKTRGEASPIWNQSDPAEGLWHIYTGGWINTNISRDDSSNFGYFYTPLGSSSPLWQAYNPTPEFLSISTQLWNYDFSSLEERGMAFEQALSLAMEDSGQGTEGSGSIRVWLVDSQAFTARRADTSIPTVLMNGVSSSPLFPFVARFNGVEGGSFRVAQPGFLLDPWNPIAGSTWIYDTFPILSTADQGTMPDPITGLYWPMRIESADCVVKEGTPISKTLDWVSLSFAPSITIPLDTWVDWDAVSQTFITLGDITTPTLEANTKCTIAYPTDLFTTATWHDGSPLTVGDFILRMILQFDRAKPGSAIYDESAVPDFMSFMSHFRGVKIESIDPLVITTYDDMRYYLDIELLAKQETWWPGYGFLGTSPGAWHNLTPAMRGEAASQIAFSSNKADQLGVEWTNFIGGPSLGILQTWMDLSAGENYIPYSPTLSEYITPDEATARWAALQAWYTTYHHFWLGTGPFYISQVSYDPKSLTLAHFDDYPDASGRWDAFAAAAQPVLEINHPSGAPGSYFNLIGTGFPPGSQAFVVSNNQIIAQVQVDEDGAVSVTLSTDYASPGEYHLRITVNPSAGVLLTLDSHQPTWPREGEFPIVRLPVLFEIRVPLVSKN